MRRAVEAPKTSCRSRSPEVDGCKKATRNERQKRPSVGTVAKAVHKLLLPVEPMSVEDCEFLNFPKIVDRRGNLTFVEGGRHIPFEIRRVYYLYDVPGGE